MLPETDSGYSNTSSSVNALVKWLMNSSSVRSMHTHSFSHVTIIPRKMPRTSRTFSCLQQDIQSSCAGRLDKSHVEQFPLKSHEKAMKAMTAVNFIVLLYVAVSFCVCISSFAYCYIFMPTVSINKDRQIRSLSGIMKLADLKPYFSFSMGCLGSSMFLATGVQSFNEASEFRRESVLVISMGMYVCLLGLLFYDVAHFKRVHLSFVLALISLGYAFSNYVIFFGADSSSSSNHGWRMIASVGYNIFGSVFFFFFLLNSYLKAWMKLDFHTMQSLLEIAWVLSLVFMLFVYASSSV